MKKLLALLVSSIMVCGGGISVCAEPQLSTPIEGEFTEYYKYTSKVYNSMTISNKTASCKSTVMGFSDKTTKVVVTHTLEKRVENGGAMLQAGQKRSTHIQRYIPRLNHR